MDTPHLPWKPPNIHTEFWMKLGEKGTLSGLYLHPPKKGERIGLGRNLGEQLFLLLLSLSAVPENCHVLTQWACTSGRRLVSHPEATWGVLAQAHPFSGLSKYRRALAASQLVLSTCLTGGGVLARDSDRRNRQIEMMTGGRIPSQEPTYSPLVPASSSRGCNGGWSGMGVIWGPSAPLAREAQGAGCGLGAQRVWRR